MSNVMESKRANKYEIIRKKISMRENLKNVSMISSGSAHTMNPRLRYKITNTCKVVLFTNARDELHMKEWAAHHILLGFDKVCIFDHKSKIPLKLTLNRFDPKVLVERCDIISSPKLRLMNIAARKALEWGATWFIYLDADEFLILPKHHNVKHFLSSYNYADSISINWLMFGSNHLKKEPEGLILETYTKSQVLLHDHCKTFVRPNAVINASNPHFYNMKNNKRIYSCFGKHMIQPYHKFDIQKSYNDTNAFIAHYVFQSEETYQNRKINLPRDDTNEMRSLDKNIHGSFNDIDNFIPKQLYAARVNKYLLDHN